MEELILFIVKKIVTHPDDVKVTVEDGEHEGTKVYIITVNDEDKGLLIGKSGRTINAIRDIVKVSAIKENSRAFVKVA